MSNLFTEVSVEQQAIVAGGWYGKGKKGFNFPAVQTPDINTQVAANTTIITQVPISYGNGGAVAGALVLQGISNSNKR
ncbi:hypothetical protein PN471_14720 [Aphanizomenon sp. CS-733/32]|uniref:hypothetical protein n=1 Tax=Aphanizomenon sp. CS-733/32 TaxID=3021715 RepID=UPI00232E5B25|nr:hypothetical protein [Aphanizomenon sp. CS-733/32]MDB9309863.1 hypothetical protein [Aphanizomenon sp. CS-733/32]